MFDTLIPSIEFLLELSCRSFAATPGLFVASSWRLQQWRGRVLKPEQILNKRLKGHCASKTIQSNLAFEFHTFDLRVFKKTGKRCQIAHLLWPGRFGLAVSSWTSWKEFSKMRGQILWVGGFTSQLTSIDFKVVQSTLIIQIEFNNRIKRRSFKLFCRTEVP